MTLSFVAFNYNYIFSIVFLPFILEKQFPHSLLFQFFFQFELTGSNLDKKDVFSESDPYFTVSRMNADGSNTLVYRSEWIKVFFQHRKKR